MSVMNIIWLISILAISGTMGSSSALGSLCGKDLQTPQLFEPMPFDPSFPSKEIIRSEELPGRLILYVRDTYNDRNREFVRVVRTADGGVSWYTEEPARLVALHEGEGTRAGYDPSVVYRREGDFYARSYDHGLHWSMPRYFVNGVTSSQFAANKLMGRRGRLYVKLSAIHPREPKTIVGSFLVYVDGDPSSPSMPINIPGLYISHDAGDNWAVLSEELLNNSPLGISPSDPRVQLGISGSGPIKTEDGGKNWHPVGEQSALMAAASPINEADVYAAARELGTNPEVIRSRAVEGSKAFIFDIEFYRRDSSFILLISNKGLFQSVDGGNSWRLLPVGPARLGFVNSALYDLLDPNVIYVGTDLYLAKSSDGGCTFQQIYPKIHKR